MIDKTNREKKPATLTVMPENIPDFLRNIPQWVGWRWEYRDGKWTKPPINLKNGDQHASSTDPSTWVVYDTAISVYENLERGFHLDGIGLAITEGNNLIGVDWDGVFDPDTGEVKYDADTAARILDTYVEWSPTHTGYRAFLQGALPGVERRSDKIEMYNRGRYMTVTGHRLPYSDHNVNNRQQEIEAFHGEVFKDKILRKKQAAKTRGRAASGSLSLQDAEVVERAKRSAHGSRFTSLYDNGDLSEFNDNHSSADLSLCNMLAFWCQKDEVQIDRIFRQSALMREKWDRPDYRTSTIEIAIMDCKDVYTAKKPGVTVTASSKRHLVTNVPVEEGDEPAQGDDPIEIDDPEAEGLPRIEVKFRQLRHVTQDAMNALIDGNDPVEVFVTNSALSRLDKDDQGKLKPTNLNVDSLTGIMTRKANFYRDGFMDCSPPAGMIRDMLSLGTWPQIPVLRSIVTSPALTTEGKIITDGGFDLESGIYYDNYGEPVPNIPLTQENFNAARALIREMIEDFPFKDEASRANTIALMLLPILRTAIVGPTPMTVFDAPVAGTGKSLLAEIILSLYCPRGIPSRSCPPQDDDAEWKKSITSAIIAKSQFFFLDNVKGSLHNSSLLSVITSTAWTDRVLGSKDQVDMTHSMIFVATANNISMDAEQSRRMVWVRLDANDEHPEKRTGFKKSNIRLWVMENRCQILASLVLIVRAWLEGGAKPSKYGTPVLGSFEAYTAIVSAVMDYVMPGFLCNREKQAAMSNDLGPWHAFTKEWFELFGSRNVGTGELLACAQKNMQELIGDKGDTSQKIRLAKQIERNNDRVFGNLKVISVGIGVTYSGVPNTRIFKLEPV